MPWCTNSISHLPTLFRVRNGGDIAYHLMSRNDWKTIAKQAVLNGIVRVADTASQHFDQDLYHENINQGSFNGLGVDILLRA